MKQQVCIWRSIKISSSVPLWDAIVKLWLVITTMVPMTNHIVHVFYAIESVLCWFEFLFCFLQRLLPGFIHVLRLVGRIQSLHHLLYMESDTFTFTLHWFIKHIINYLLKRSICASLTESMATSTDDAEPALMCPVRQCNLWTRTKQDCNVCQSVAISRERFCMSLTTGSVRSSKSKNNPVQLLQSDKHLCSHTASTEELAAFFRAMNISTMRPRAHMVWIMRITQYQERIPYGKGLIYILHACTISTNGLHSTCCRVDGWWYAINDRRQKKTAKEVVKFSQFCCYWETMTFVCLIWIYLTLVLNRPSSWAHVVNLEGHWHVWH